MSCIYCKCPVECAITGAYYICSGCYCMKHSCSPCNCDERKESITKTTTKKGYVIRTSTCMYCKRKLLLDDEDTYASSYETMEYSTHHICSDCYCPVHIHRRCLCRPSRWKLNATQLTFAHPCHIHL
jgi:hypothetical protein